MERSFLSAVGGEFKMNHVVSNCQNEASLETLQWYSKSFESGRSPQLYNLLIEDSCCTLTICLLLTTIRTYPDAMHDGESVLFRLPCFE